MLPVGSDRASTDEARASSTGVNAQPAVTRQRTYRCGNSMYYVVESHGYLVVRSQDFFRKTFIGYATNLPSAISMIRRDAKSNRLRTA
jgi:hypothetical protein